MIPTLFAIDEFGRVYNGDKMCTQSTAEKLLSSLSQDAQGRFVFKTDDGSGKTADKIVEVFDQPLIIYSVLLEDKHLVALNKLGFEFNIDFTKLYLDDWDRFIGQTTEGIPYVLNKTAQAELFNFLDEYDDESITFQDKVYEIPLLTEKAPPPLEKKEGLSPALGDMLPRLKLSKSRIAVVGNNNASNIAHLKNMGHLVTPIDNLLKYNIEPDRFDFIYHSSLHLYTLAEQKKQIQLSKQLLIESGFLFLDIYLDSVKTEWYYRELTQKHLQFLFWSRWKNESDSELLGKRLFIYGVIK